MAEIVGRILVENGQERILHRIYDGLTSNLILDVADSKQSQEHQLIHLVWRKFPRNRYAVEGPKTTSPSSTQTEVDLNMGPFKIPENSINSVTNCSLAAGKGPLVHSASSSDSGSSERYNSKGQSKKLRNPEKIDQIQLSNRFDCLENEGCPEISNKNTSSSDRESTNVQRGRPRGSPKTFNTKINSTTSKISPKPVLSSVNGTVEHKSLPKNKPFNVPTSFGSVSSGISDDGVKAQVESHRISSVPSVPSRVSTDTRGTVKSCNWAGGYVTPDGACVDVPFRDTLYGFKPGQRAIFVLESDTLGGQRATEICPIHDALSTTRLSDSD